MRMVDVTVTLTVDGDEKDCSVRGFVTVDGDSAVVDGEPQVWIGHDEFCPLSSVNVDPADIETIDAALCEAALEAAADEVADREYERTEAAE